MDYQRLDEKFNIIEDTSVIIIITKKNANARICINDYATTITDKIFKVLFIFV